MAMEPGELIFDHVGIPTDEKQPIYSANPLKRRAVGFGALFAGVGQQNAFFLARLQRKHAHLKRGAIHPFQQCGIAALIAAPWHLYQLAVHTRWFWTEYIVTENFTWAVAAPEQSTQENQVWYYLKRLAVTDPLLCVAAMSGIPAAMRGRDRLLAAWIGVVLLALLAFGYRNTSYLLLLIPALCLLGGQTPLPWIFAVLAAIKLTTLPYHAEHPMPSVGELQAYASLHRPNDLIIIAPDDEFVSSTLALRHVRYCFFEANPNPVRLPLDFRYLGVTVTIPEFNHLAVALPVFRQHLAGFGLDSTAPVATVILARDPEELRGLIAAHPETDFSLPSGFAQFADERHAIWNRSAGRLFLFGQASEGVPR